MKKIIIGALLLLGYVDIVTPVIEVGRADVIGAVKNIIPIFQDLINDGLIGITQLNLPEVQTKMNTITTTVNDLWAKRTAIDAKYGGSNPSDKKAKAARAKELIAAGATDATLLGYSLQGFTTLFNLLIKLMDNNSIADALATWLENFGRGFANAFADPAKVTEAAQGLRNALQGVIKVFKDNLPKIEQMQTILQQINGIVKTLPSN